jgi:ABC-2 type transport system permease protein/capsular polysaccharide transport system permease protein
MDGSANTNLLQSLRIQWRVTWALLLREMITRYGRYNIGFLWLFLEPMLFTLGVTALWTASGASHGSSLPIVAFGVTGYSAVLLWRSMPYRCIKAIEPNLSLMYHRNVKVLDIYVSRLLIEIAGATISFVVLSAAFIFLGMMGLPEDPLKIAGAWALLAWFGVGLALFLGAWSEESQAIAKIWSPVSYIAFPLSGAAFIVDALPAKMQAAVLMIPMVHGTELLREGYFGSVVRSHYDIPYFVAWCIAVTLLGLAKVRNIGRKVTPE